MNNNLKIISVFTAQQGNYQALPFPEALLSAGFPSSAENFTERSLDLNDLLIKNSTSTFYIKVIGDSMINAGINSNDILIVDRSLTPTNNSIAVVRINNEFTVKRIKFEHNKVLLIPENEKYKVTEITGEMDFEIWGIVTFIIHKA